MTDPKATLEQVRSAIAAAPDLIAALESATKYIEQRVTNPDRGTVGRALLPRLRAAIEKASGR